MAYQQMAYVYDRFMKDAPYDKWMIFVEKMIEQAHFDVQDIVDLGCGTGEMTLRLADNGYRLIGIDNSSEMLAAAEKKAQGNSQGIFWLQQDLRSLTGLHDIDVAVSLCDVMNYITTPQEVQQVFQHVANLLREGGLFIFDVHSIDHVENNMIAQTFADVTDQNAYIWFCDEGDDQGEMYHELTFFLANGDAYERFDESHFQKTFPVQVYKQYLQDAGFEVTGIYSDFSLEKNEIPQSAERIFFCAKK